MDGDEDFVMAPPADAGALTSEDYEEVQGNTDFCVLCTYGSVPGQETCMLVNSDIKSLEQVVAQLRKSMNVKRASREIHRYYMQNVRPHEPYSDDPEWTVECIEDHLCRHAAPEAAGRGERPGEDMAYEIFSNALHVQSKALVNKETGLIDEKQAKIMCQLADR